MKTNQTQTAIVELNREAHKQNHFIVNSVAYSAMLRKIEA